MILAPLCFLWAGMVLGISFLAIPAKFTVPGLALSTNLSVGQHIFSLFSKVELGLAFIALALVIRARPARAIWLLLAGVLFSVLLQCAWLLPVMDARIAMRMAGEIPPPAFYHPLYIALEFLKLSCLMAMGIASLRR